ncbi:MAG: hypothetical protein CMI52_02635 [Parcubacteria group bacterium]|nr:hypothetical protein [Parcubacteria group bacterium]|tara:strand:- start:349 stop:669 length:321 start_codon:yes stop_codon:yes gene_type:complete
MEWKRIVDLVKKTGERCVVIDPDHDEPVVIMPLSEYECMADQMDEEFDFGLDGMRSDIPFEPEADWIPDFAQEEEPILEVIEEHIDEEDEPVVSEESWYIEPIEGE